MFLVCCYLTFFRAICGARVSCFVFWAGSFGRGGVGSSQEATRERSSLSSELLGLKEDIEALELRKKLVTDQVRARERDGADDSWLVEGARTAASFFFSVLCDVFV